MSFPIMTTTAEVINVLSGANDAVAGKKTTTNMRLYLRERGQGEYGVRRCRLRADGCRPSITTV
jgi:hypothetical protein